MIDLLQRLSTPTVLSELQVALRTPKDTEIRFVESCPQTSDDNSQIVVDPDFARLANWHREASRDGTIGPLYVALPVPTEPQENARGAWIEPLEEGFRLGRAIPLPPTTSPTDGSEPLPDYELRRLTYDGVRMRDFREGDEPAILDLFHRCFHPDFSLDHWKWRYAQNPEGQFRISLAFDESSRLVGQYCAYPVRLRREDGSLRLVHQVGDTMTDASVRGLGRGPNSVLTRVASHFYTCHCEDRVDFNYGFNTGNIQRFSIRFVGAQKVEDAAYRVLRGAPTPRRLFGRRYDIEPLVEAGDEVDELFAEASSDYPTLLVRDARYLNWRYFAHPDRPYRVVGAFRRGRLVGWCAFRRGERGLLWGDALFLKRHRHAARDILAATRHGEETVEGWFPDRPDWWLDSIERLGMQREDEPQQLGMVVVPFREPEACRQLQEKLYYTFGDSDLF